MSDLNEINRAIGSLEAQVQNLTTAVTTLTGVEEGFKKTSWTSVASSPASHLPGARWVASYRHYSGACHPRSIREVDGRPPH